MHPNKAKLVRCPRCGAFVDHLFSISAYGMPQEPACETCRPGALVFGSEAQRNQALTEAIRHGRIPSIKPIINEKETD